MNNPIHMPRHCHVINESDKSPRLMGD